MTTAGSNLSIHLRLHLHLTALLCQELWRSTNNKKYLNFEIKQCCKSNLLSLWKAGRRFVRLTQQKKSWVSRKTMVFWLTLGAKSYNINVMLEDQGWHSGETTCLQPRWPGFDSWTWHHTCMWVVSFVCSLLWLERFLSGYSDILYVPCFTP